MLIDLAYNFKADCFNKIFSHDRCIVMKMKSKAKQWSDFDEPDLVYCRNCDDLNMVFIYNKHTTQTLQECKSVLCKSAELF